MQAAFPTPPQPEIQFSLSLLRIATAGQPGSPSASSAVLEQLLSEAHENKISPDRRGSTSIHPD